MKEWLEENAVQVILVIGIGLLLMLSYEVAKWTGIQ